MKIFVLTKKSGPFFYLFCSKIWPFSLKKNILNIFFETAHRICLKLGQNLGTIALDHWMAVLCLGKFSFGRFGPFFLKNTLHVVTNWGFWPFLTNFFQSADVCWTIFFCFLNQVYGLRQDKVSLGCDKNFFGHFWTFFGPKFGHFCSKIRFLAGFFKTAYQNFT